MEAHSSDERTEHIGSAQLIADDPAEESSVSESDPSEPSVSRPADVAVSDGAVSGGDATSGEVSESDGEKESKSDHEEELGEVVLDLGELNAGTVVEDEAIEVSDEELTEVTTLGDSARSATRSLPPPRPSLRVPRTSAPPPRKSRSSLLPGQPTLSSIPAARISSPPGAVLADLRLALAQSRARVEDLTVRLQKSEAARSNTEQRLRAALQRIAELERAEAGNAGAAEAPQSKQASALSAKQGSSPSSERSERGTGTESEPQAKASAHAQAADRSADEGVRPQASGDAEPPATRIDAEQDADLRQIEGIGPRFEATLRRHGVTRVSQVAAWSEADIKRIAKRMKIPRSRIVKGRWVERAREVLSATPAQ